MIIFFYIFAIIGIQLFDRFTHSHRTDLDYHKAFEVSVFRRALRVAENSTTIFPGPATRNDHALPIIHTRSLVQTAPEPYQSHGPSLAAHLLPAVDPSRLLHL